VSRHIITVISLHNHVLWCLTQAEVDRLVEGVAGNVATTIRNHVIEACKAIDAENATPPADDVARCAEALAVLSHGVHDAIKAMYAPLTHQERLNAGLDILNTAQVKATNILEGETP
jgi:hypothetical protein